MIVAVVPFGARAADEVGQKRAGAWARQIARRLVERFAGEPAVELRPVFLVTVPEGAAPSGGEREPGYLIFGSTPEPKLAAEYARGLDASHVITGTYHDEGDGRRIEVTLTLVEPATPVATGRLDVADGRLQDVEAELASWLASALRLTPVGDLTSTPVASEDAYAALLEGMDAEVDVTLLRTGDLRAARAALEHAAASYARAVRSDPASTVLEDRILVLAATSIENDEQPLALPALEALIEARPSSWRAQYMLGEVRRTSGDLPGAIVALEHADALTPLRDADALGLARLYAASGARSSAVSRLRRLVQRGQDLEAVAGARRLLLSLQHPELEQVLEEAGRIAVEGDATRSAQAEAGFERVLAADPDLWEAHFGRALLALQRGEAGAARDAFERARRLNPASAAMIEDLQRP